MKRSAIRRKTPLAKISKKRASQMARYYKLRASYLLEFPICEICKSSPAVDIHHKFGRDNERLCQTAWFMAVCRDCQSFTHAHPKEAMERGYIISRL